MADRDEMDAIAAMPPVTRWKEPAAKEEWPREPRRRQPRARHAFHDEARIEGIPARDMTPAVQEAIVGLLETRDALSQDLEHALEHVARLEAQADQHPLLPLLNRHALLRELDKAIQRVGHTGMAATFAWFHFRNAAAIRREFGLPRLEKALTAAAKALTAALRATDVAGALGDADFGVVLELAGGKAAETKADELALLLESLPLPTERGPIRFRVSLGLKELTGDADTASVVEAVDIALRTRDMAESTGA